jgi:serine/threonine protein phosphatase 1
MVAFMTAPMDNRAWLRHGGAETLLCYGVAPPSTISAQDDELNAAAEALKAKLPPAHLDFLNGLERYVVLGDYAFVHAGVDPARSLEEQTDSDLYWIRERFHTSKRRFSHRVVHGHTVTAEPFADVRRVGIDTGAYASGVLTAARFEGAEISFLSVDDRARA